MRGAAVRVPLSKALTYTGLAVGIAIIGGSLAGGVAIAANSDDNPPEISSTDSPDPGTDADGAPEDSDDGGEATDASEDDTDVDGDDEEQDEVDPTNSPADVDPDDDEDDDDEPDLD
jgi:hypothetical protein